MRSTLSASVVAFFAIFAATQAVADQSRTLTIDVQVKGEEAWQENGSWEKGVINESFSVTTTLTSDGGMSAVNILDPKSTQAAQDRSNQQRERTAQIQQRQKSLEAAGGMPSAQAQQEMNATIMQAYQRCKGNENCIREAVMKSSPHLMTPPPGITMAPGAALGNVPEAQDAKEIYQQWLSADGCAGTFKAFREDISNGMITDVGGARPRKFEIRMNDGGEREGLCHSYAMTTVDTEKKLLFVESFALPQAQAKRTSTGTGVLGAQTTAAIPGDILAWVNKSLRGVPLSGTKSETITLKNPVVVSPWKNYSGKATVTISWSFK